jgi:predicted anti-sigma-YlaC factor YlaD
VTTTCRDLRPLLGAYVLGALDPDETAVVREHVASCAACASEHARLAPLPGLLTLAEGAQRATADPPSPAMEERLLDVVAREAPRRRARRRPFRRRFTGFAAAGLATAAIAVIAVVVIGGGGSDHPYFPLHATSASTGAVARAELRQVAGGTSMQLWVSGLPRDTAAVYEVHCDAPDWSASAGTFRVDGQGRAHVELTTAARRGQYDRIRITRKTATGERTVFAAALS